MKKAYPFRFDHNGKTLDAGDLPVIASGDVAGREVLILRNETDFFYQSRDSWGTVNLNPMSKDAAEFAFAKLENKQFDYGRAFGDKQPVFDSYIPGIYRP